MTRAATGQATTIDIEGYVDETTAGSKKDPRAILGEVDDRPECPVCEGELGAADFAIGECTLCGTTFETEFSVKRKAVRWNVGCRHCGYGTVVVDGRLLTDSVECPECDNELQIEPEGITNE